VAAHGAQKLFGWFGGAGLAGTGGSFENLGFRPGKLHAFLAGTNEIGGGLLLAVGLLTPLAAAAVIAVVLVAAISVRAKAFFVQTGGFEYTFVIVVIALSLTFTGPGPVSLDAAFGLPLAGPGWAAGALVVGIMCAMAMLRNRRPPGNGASPLRADGTSAMTLDPGEIQRECTHSSIEHLGNNRGARFYKCEGCYQNEFPHAKLTRSRNGVLEVVLHANDGTLIVNEYTHEEFLELFHQIGQDPGNRVVILTGAADAFIDRIDPEGFDFFSPRGYDKIYREGKKVLSNLLDIPVPVIAALNGPTTVHSEYVLLADIVIATPDTVFQGQAALRLRDRAGRRHSLALAGGHRLDPRHTFVLTQQVIGADEAKTPGVISEIVARDPSWLQIPSARRRCKTDT